MQNNKFNTERKWNLLIITYDFPPDVMGVRRIVKFCEYLPEYKWTPLVLTVKAKRGIRFEDSRVENLSQKGVKIFRSGSADPYRISFLLRSLFQPGRRKRLTPHLRQTGGLKKKIARWLREWLFIPDDRVLWVPFAVLKGLRIIRKEKPAVILSTSFPSSAHLVGLILKKLTKRYWVADFRDGWLQNPVFYKTPTPIHHALQSALERMVAEYADLIIGVTEPITRYFALRSYDKTKCITITNGFDPEDFKAVEPRRPEPSDKFVLLYSGTLFEPRTAEPLLKAIKLLLDERPGLREGISLSLLSALSDRDLDLIKQLSLERIVRLVGFLPYHECIAYQKGADVLVLIISPEENPSIMMTQKVFEYLASGRPILGIVSDGPCKELINSLSAGKTANYDDIPEIKNAITEFFGEWCKGKLTGVSPEKIQQFSRRALTEKLALELFKRFGKSERSEKRGTS
ncbi:hypothetical protein J7M23_06145 [Candidatus Sumerlaeota bacterium]|nr:hypothetical protein [Candidatus Sumerlaeota bacterium]